MKNVVATISVVALLSTAAFAAQSAGGTSDNLEIRMIPTSVNVTVAQVAAVDRKAVSTANVSTANVSIKGAKLLKPAPQKDLPVVVAGVEIPEKKVVKPAVQVVDDYEDGDFSASPEWWKFDRLLLSVGNNNVSEYKGLGKKSLVLEGSTVNSYIGGLGVYLGLDASEFKGLVFTIFGNGEDSGTLKIELYDDDNGNWVVDTAPGKGYAPSADDLYVTRIPVNWTGWRVVKVPFTEFEDENPGVGDDKFNPSQLKTSGGLLQMQIIASSSRKAVGKIDCRIDSISLYRR